MTSKYCYHVLQKKGIAATIQRIGTRSTSCPKLITDLYKKSYPCPVLAAKREIGAGKIIAAKVAIRINGRRCILENSILSSSSNSNTSCDFFKIVLQSVIANLGANNSYVLYYKGLVDCCHIQRGIIEPQVMFVLHRIIRHMELPFQKSVRLWGHPTPEAGCISDFSFPNPPCCFLPAVRRGR